MSEENESDGASQQANEGEVKNWGLKALATAIACTVAGIATGTVTSAEAGKAVTNACMDTAKRHFVREEDGSKQSE